MKIFFITTGDIVSIGTIKRAIGMSTPLQKLGHDISIILLDTPNNRQRVQLECSSINILWFKHSGVLTEVSVKSNLIKEFNPDIVYVCAFGFRNWVFGLFNKKNTIYVVEHSELGSGIKSAKLSRRLTVGALEYLSLILFSGQVFASKYLEKVFNQRKKKLFKKEVKSLYSPYAYSNQLTEVNSTLLDKLKIEIHNKKVICYMGTLVKNYGILDILNAIKQLSNERKDFIFIVIGGGRHKEQMLDLIKQNQIEEFVYVAGFVSEEELNTYFSLTDVFLAPLYDTVQDWARCPSKMYMYLPFKKPIVTSKIGEAVTLFSDNGFYCDPVNPNSMSSTINDALSIDENWKPKINIDKNSWEARSEDFIQWVKSDWPHLSL